MLERMARALVSRVQARAGDVAAVLAPMTVVPLRVLRERKAIPRSSERPTVGTEHVPDGAPVVFFSQRWLTPHMDAAKAHPDDKSASKWRTMVETMETAVEEMQAAGSQGRLGDPVRKPPPLDYAAFRAARVLRENTEPFRL